MNLKRFSIRFNLDDPNDLKAWRYLHRKSDHVVSKEIIETINKACELSDAERLLRKVVSEEMEKSLKAFSFEPVKTDPETIETENSIMDFLECFLWLRIGATSCYQKQSMAPNRSQREKR